MSKPIILTQTEILALAIRAMTPEVKHYAGIIATAPPDIGSQFLKAYGEKFYKFSKLLELYELQCGTEYDIDFDFPREG